MRTVWEKVLKFLHSSLAHSKITRIIIPADGGSRTSFNAAGRGRRVRMNTEVWSRREHRK